MALVKYNNNSLSAITTTASMPAGAMVLIKEQTASASSTISFVNGTSDVVISSAYPIYLFKIIFAHPATDGEKLTFQGSTNTGSSYGVTATSTAFDSEHSEGDASSFAYNTSADLAQGTGYQELSLNNIGNDNDQTASGELWLFSPSSTTFVKHYIYWGNSVNSGDYDSNDFAAGYFNTTSAVDAIQFKMSSGNIDAGTFKLYGIKDS